MEYRLTEDWKDIKEIIIFGFGKVAHDNIGFFSAILKLCILWIVIKKNAIVSLKIYR